MKDGEQKNANVCDIDKSTVEQHGRSIRVKEVVVVTGKERRQKKDRCEQKTINYGYRKENRQQIQIQRLREPQELVKNIFHLLRIEPQTFRLLHKHANHFRTPRVFRLLVSRIFQGAERDFAILFIVQSSYNGLLALSERQRDRQIRRQRNRKMPRRLVKTLFPLFSL